MDKLIDLEMDDESILDAPVPAPERSNYPYGLRICLTDKECAKLGLDPHEVSTGDYLTFKAEACVTCVSCNDGGDYGHSDRVELQIEKMSPIDEE